MKNSEKFVRYALIGISLCCVLVLSGALNEVAAQKGGGRDPFTIQRVDTRKLQQKGNKLEPVVQEAPPIEQRIALYKQQKEIAMRAGVPAPKPTTMLLLKEVQVTGIFQTPRGYAAMVEAKPIGLSYVIYPGEQFFDGQLVAIEENQLICRKEVRWSDKRIEKRVEKLPLAQPNAVRDQMTQARAGGSTADGEKAGDKSAEAAFVQMMELLQKLLTASQQQSSSPEKKQQ